MFYVTRTVLVELAISNQSFRKTTGASPATTSTRILFTSLSLYGQSPPNPHIHNVLVSSPHTPLLAHRRHLFAVLHIYYKGLVPERVCWFKSSPQQSNYLS